MGKDWSLWYRFVRTFVRFCFFVPLGGFRVLRADRVPPTGPLIVAPIHLSLLDPPAIGCALPRGLRFMSKEELWRFRPLGVLISSLGAFPLRRGAGDTEAIRKAIEELERGCAVLVFPEGTRGDARTMLPVNRGVAMLAKRTGAWVLPVGICGTHRCLPRGGKGLHRGRTVIAFGEPFRYADAAGDDAGSARRGSDAFARVLQARVLQATREAGLDLKPPDQDALKAAATPQPE